MSERLARAAIEDVLEEPHRAIAITPGADLAAILKYALQANRRRLFRDISLSVILCGMIGVVIFRGHIPLAPLILLALLIATWCAVFIDRYVRLFGPAARGLRPGMFDPANAPAPVNDPFADRQLARVAAASQGGNVTVYGAYPPFVGYGGVKTSWSFTIDVTRPRRGEHLEPFTVQEVYDHIEERLTGLDLPGIAITCRVFVNGQDIYDDGRFLPRPDSRPVMQVGEELLRELMSKPEERARPYLTVGMTGWQGDFVVTMFLRFLLSRTDLFVEAAHTAVGPLRPEFRAIDTLGPVPTGGQFFRLVWQSSKSTIPRLIGSVPGVFHAIGQTSRRDRKQRRFDETSNYGSLVSIREAAADPNWQRYFQVFDQERYMKVTEARIFSSLVDFLDDHGVDVSELVSRQETIINNKTVFGDNFEVDARNSQGSQIAVGKGATATARIRLNRGQKGQSGGGS